MCWFNTHSGNEWLKLEIEKHFDQERFCKPEGAWREQRQWIKKQNLQEYVNLVQTGLESCINTGNKALFHKEYYDRAMISKIINV